MMHVYERPKMKLVRGKGCWLYDEKGKVYLDFVSGVGVNALGHGHPRILATLATQAAELLHCGNLYHHPYAAPLAGRLAEWSGLPHCFFSNSGAEAMEAALKAARAARPERRKMVALEGGFHGRTLGALSVTSSKKYREAFGPLPGPVTFVPPNNLEALAAALTEETLAVVAEVVQGEGGVVPLKANYLHFLRNRCSELGIYWIADETQCGLGRTGNRFAYQQFPALAPPDIVTTAKPLGGGLPLGATLFAEEFAQVFAGGRHGSTFGGGPLACRLGLEVLSEIEELLPGMAGTAEAFRSGLEALREEFPIVAEVRGQGLLWGLVLQGQAAPVVEAAREHGLLINATQGKVLRMLPAYVMRVEEVQEGMRRLRRALQQCLPYPPAQLRRPSLLPKKKTVVSA